MDIHAANEFNIIGSNLAAEREIRCRKDSTQGKFQVKERMMMLQLKDAVKNKLCVIEKVPNYPLLDLVEWLDTLRMNTSHPIILLDQIQVELDTEVAVLAASAFAHDPQILTIKRYLCLYCA